MATSQLEGESSLAGLDRSRADAAGALLAPVPFASSRTTARLAQRFGPDQRAGIEAGLAVIAERMTGFLPAQRCTDLVTHRSTLDCDSTDVEVYGRKKRGVAYTHDGKKAGRPLLISWARTVLTLAAELLAGNQDPRPSSSRCCTGRWRCCRPRCAPRPGCAVTAGSSRPRSCGPRPRSASISRSPRRATRRCGGRTPRFPRTGGSMPVRCAARRSGVSNTWWRRTANTGAPASDSPQSAHDAGSRVTVSSGSSTMFRVLPGSPCCLPFARPDLARDDRFGAFV
ncbi:hypothetical protein FDG2_4142 [Candidatus Protofrankia californiensis]|uniref:Transposase n=1 Tax=Candidatus Protofrankia californiensis TaxID=1839754 RepID=A0A1C3P3S0_9ACTN|nr:hypothetical protein FDG2_4142 [Candidatus Protofrankia californiensis]